MGAVEIIVSIKCLSLNPLLYKKWHVELVHCFKNLCDTQKSYAFLYGKEEPGDTIRQTAGHTPQWVSILTVSHPVKSRATFYSPIRANPWGHLTVAVAITFIILSNLTVILKNKTLLITF